MENKAWQGPGDPSRLFPPLPWWVPGTPTFLPYQRQSSGSKLWLGVSIHPGSFGQCWGSNPAVLLLTP